MFLTQILAVNGDSFEINRTSVNPYRTLNEREMLDKLERARIHEEKGQFRDAADISSDMRVKYKL